MDFTWCSQWDGKKYDVVFYGMSGYSGYLMMEYLKRGPLRSSTEDFTFAFAGRSASKVEEMRYREFAGTEWEDTPILTASFEDVVSLVDLVKSARVLVNVAGPYMLTEGEVLVDACIWCKTDYVDVSQEVPWSLRIKELHKYAVEAGVMIVPSAASNAYADLGVHMLAKKLRDDFGEPTASAVCYRQGGGPGGVSGGMLKTRAAIDKIDEETQAKMVDPFSLGGFVPNVDRCGVKVVNIQQGTGKVTVKARDEDTDAKLSEVTEDRKNGLWRAPFVDAPFDARIVRRSNMLHADLGNAPYGTNLNFTEFALLPPESVARARALAKQDRVSPYSQSGVPFDEEQEELDSEGKHYPLGEGPAIQDMTSWSGYFLAAESSSGNSVKCSFVGADGYYETSRMAVEAALTLCLDREHLPYRGGVLTPSTAGGTRLIERVKHSGVKFKLGAWMDSIDLAPPRI